MRKRFLLALVLGAVVVSKGVLPAAVNNWEDNPSGNTGALKGQIETAGSYHAHSGNATRIVNDLHVPGALGEYGLDFTRYWNSEHSDYDHEGEADWSLDFGTSGWSHSWHWAAVESHQGGEPILGTEEETTVRKTTITITFPDGHTARYQIIRCVPASWTCSGPPPGASDYGPPYSPAEINAGWPNGGFGVHDHISKMATDGSNFWLARADGGSVHFTGGPGGYNATEVYDPHGFRTILEYNQGNGKLEWVNQDGGRSLHLTWEEFGDDGLVITRVDTAGIAGLQHLTYQYTRTAGYLVLAKVNYESEALPGPMPIASYTYGTCWGAGTEPCSPWTGEGAEFPLLKQADDPHFAGPMTKIRYEYRGQPGCPPPPAPPTGHPATYHDYVLAQPYAIAAEKAIGMSWYQDFS